MEQTFRYPNLMSGTDKWTDWWTPGVGKENSCYPTAIISLPRPIEQDDVAYVSVEMEFDRLDLTADTAKLYFQGPVDNSWLYCNAFTTGFRSFAHDVFDGAVYLSNTFRVNSRIYNVGADKYNQTPVGHSTFEFGLRADYCGGGVAPCAPPHGRAQHGGCAARMGTGIRGGVALSER